MEARQRSSREVEVRSVQNGEEDAKEFMRPVLGAAQCSASESDSGESESDDEQPMQRSLVFNNSIYDEAFVIPLVHGVTENGTWRYSISAVLQVVLLLLLNMMLQGLVLMKVRALALEEKTRMRETLWEVCEDVDPAVVRFPRNLEAPESGQYIDCAPLAVTLMANVTQLDLDNDGFWTEEEADKLQRWMETNVVPREANLPLVIRGLLRKARKGQLRAQQQGEGQATAFLDVTQATQDFTRLPMSWMDEEQKNLQLCSAMDPMLCTNLEMRKILPARMPHLNDTRFGREDRINACEDLIRDYCMSVFGERYKLYIDHTARLCGGPLANWDSELRIRSVVYERSYQYVSSKDGVVHTAYMSFLFVVLLIWLAAMLQEFREVCDWWLVMFALPVFTGHGCKSGEHGEVYAVVNHRIKIKAVPRVHKYMTMALNLLPRTLLCVGLVWIGVQFLLRADNYSDLILNSVALGFLIEVDNMLYAAVVADSNKDVLEQTDPISIRCHGRRQWPTWVHMKGDRQTFFYTLGILLFAGFLEYKSYFFPGGKMVVGSRLTCFCQMAGQHCAGAQILGGLPQIPGVERMDSVR